MRTNTLKSSLLLLLLNCGMISTGIAQTKPIKQSVEDPLELYNPSPELIKARLARQVKESKQTSPALITYRQNNACNLVANGDFEIQSAVPSQTGNIASRVPGSVSQLPNWFSPNFTTPDYIARNASTSGMTPAASSRGAFTPLNGANPSTVDGTAGIVYSRLIGGPQGYPEYIAQQLAQPLNGGARYYAEFWTHSASQFAFSNRLGLYVSNNANWGGNANPTSGSATNYTDPPVQLPLNNGRGFTSGQLNTPNQWIRVSGTFTANAGDNFLNIGYPDPDGSSQTSFPGQIQASYYYIDDVALYRIPTAGPDQACTSVPVQLGEGCSIPGASFTWTQNGSSTVLATTLQWNVRPTSTTTYTLTVQLPDGSTHTTSATVSACPSCPVLADAPDFYLVEQTPNTTNSNATFNIKVRNMPGVEFFTLNLQNGNPSANITRSVNDDGFGFSTFVLGLIGETWYQTTVVASNSCGNVSPTAYKYLRIPGCPPGGCNGGGEDPYFTSTTPAYPNPAVTTLTVEVKNPSHTGFIYLIDGKGHVARKMRADQQKQTLNVQDLPAGLYQLVTPGAPGKKSVRTTIQVTH